MNQAIIDSMTQALSPYGFTADQVAQMMSNPELARQMMLAKGMAPQAVDSIIASFASIQASAPIIGSALGGAVGSAGMMAVIAGMGVMLLVMLVVMIVVYGIPLFKLAKRFSVPHAWMAWVPLLQFFTMVQIAGKPWWWGFAFLAAIVPAIGPIAVMVFAIWMLMEISKRTGHPMWVGLFGLIPALGFLVLYYFAFAKPGAIFPAAEVNGTPTSPSPSN